MNQEYLRFRLKVPNPLHEVVLICVGREAPNGIDLRLYRYVFTKNFHLLGPFHDLASCGPLRLETYDDETCPLSPEIMFQVMLDSTRCAHAVTSDDDGGP